MRTQRGGVLIFSSSYPHPGNPVYGIFIRDFLYSIRNSVRAVLLTPRFPGTCAAENQDGVAIRRFAQCCPASSPLAGKPGGMLPALKRSPWLVLCLPFFLLSEYRALRKTVKQEKIGVIHAHWLIPQGLLAAIWKVFFDPQIRLIITCHGSDVNKLNAGPLAALKRFALRHADRVVAVSGSMQKTIQETAPGVRCEVRAMGVDMTQFRPGVTEPDVRSRWGFQGRIVLFAGSLFELKGVRELLAGFRILHGHCPDVHLVFAGDGELRQELQDTAAQWGLDRFVHLPGAVPHDQLPAFFAQSEVFILPSFSEGLGLVVVEALACGASAVISELPALLALDKEQKLFYVCRAGDAESIAGALEEALRHPRSVQQCRTWAESSFSLQGTADFYLRLYRE